MNRITRFWQEIKRRNIVRRNAVYAATAYVILELVSIIEEPLNLPEWTLSMLIVLLSIGFVVSIILTWNYDITSEGMKRIESSKIEKNSNKKLALKLSKRKIKVSDVVIACLVIAVGILAYPRIFTGSGSLNAMTVPVAVKNEFGEEELHDVFTEAYLTKIAIYPFTNEGDDSTLNWLQHGIYEAVAEDLSQFNYMSVDWNGDLLHLNEQIKRAKANNYNRFIKGSYSYENDVYRVSTKIYRTENGTILSERVLKGTDFFNLMDSISLQIRTDLGISKDVLNSSVDLPLNVFMTDHLDAFKYYIDGAYSDTTWANLRKAIELDSTFALALYYRAFLNQHFEVNHQLAEYDIKQAMRHRQRMPDRLEINTRLLYYSILGENEKAVALMEMQSELKPYDTQILSRLIDIYNMNLMFQKAEEATIKLNQLMPDHPDHIMQLGEAYLLNGKPDQGIKVIEDLLSAYPENTDAMLLLGELLLHKNDLENAEKMTRKAILLSPEDEKDWSLILNHFEYIRNQQSDLKFYESYAYYYRFEDSEIGITFSIHNNHLLAGAKNQGSFFFYPISDTVLINYSGYFNEQFVLNEDQEVIRIDHYQKNYGPAGRDAVWKEDSLIQDAKTLLLDGNHSDALNAFRRAYNQNPQHYYLANYIQHLEFIQSPEYTDFQHSVDHYMGEYGDARDISLYLNEKQVYLRNEMGAIYELLPLSKREFMRQGFYWTYPIN